MTRSGRSQSGAVQPDAASPPQGQCQSQWMEAEPPPATGPGDDPGTLTDEDSLWTDGPDAVDAAAPDGSDTRRDQARDATPQGPDPDRSQAL